MLAKSLRRAVIRLGTPLAMALMLPLTAPPASAEGLTIHFNSEHHGESHHGDRRYFGREHHSAGHGHSHSRNRHSGHHQKQGHHAAQRQREHDKHGRYTSRDCRKVTKQAYQDGRLAKIAGKLCYDRHGNPYIVKGSRHVVRYYD